MELSGQLHEILFLFVTASRRTLGPIQPPIQLLPGIVSPGVKRPRREADNSPPSSAGVKNTRSCTSTHPYVFMESCLIKHRIRLHGVGLSFKLEDRNARSANDGTYFRWRGRKDPYRLCFVIL